MNTSVLVFCSYSKVKCSKPSRKYVWALCTVGEVKGVVVYHPLTVQSYIQGSLMTIYTLTHMT